MDNPTELKARILELVREYSRNVHKDKGPGSTMTDDSFTPGVSTVPYAGRVFDSDEVEAAVSSMLDFWLTLGPEGSAMEEELARFIGAKHTLLVNSGSSANLIAVTTLTAHELPRERRILPGDEVITAAASFPTTVAPILQNGAVPVFIDVDPITGNILPEQLEAAYVPGKTKAVIVAHTLGNPFDLARMLDFCRRHNLWLIEDNCDALGCTYSMPVERARELGLDHLFAIAATGSHPVIRIENLGGREVLTAPTGSWGDLSTQSFYPPHHITMGEGGAVNIISRGILKKYAESFRDWGRDCWCASGHDDTCHNRFGWKLGELPHGYDHKYIYSRMGYNLKPLDPQAAIGRVQMRKLPDFVLARQRNWEILRASLADLEEYFDFSLPTHATGWISPEARQGTECFNWDDSGCRSGCSWFGFMLRVRRAAPFSRTDFARHLDKCRIGNRMLFGGNLVHQPAFVRLRKDNPEAFRVAADTNGADHIMNDAIFLGTYPGLTTKMMDYTTDVIHRFCNSSGM